MDSPAVHSWETLLLSVLTAADRELGFGPPWQADHGTSERQPGDAALAKIDVGGLQRNRVVGLTAATQVPWPIRD